MARRGGKAANRRDRQRKAQRRTLQRPAAPAAPAPRAGRADPRFPVSGPSRLSERAATEYHYVRRDLRNIAVLVVVMAVLLAAAVVAFSVLGIGPS
jgi:hypothetical protein